MLRKETVRGFLSPWTRTLVYLTFNGGPGTLDADCLMGQGSIDEFFSPPVPSTV